MRWLAVALCVAGCADPADGDAGLDGSAADVDRRDVDTAVGDAAVGDAADGDAADGDAADGDAAGGGDTAGGDAAGGDASGGRACSFRGIEVLDGQRLTVYGARTVPSGSSCASVAQERVCDDGRLTGDATFASCVEVLPAFGGRRRWYYAWDGSGNPNDMRVPYSLWLDQPHGDDYDDFDDPVINCRAHYDSPSRGHFSIDLLKTPTGHPCPLTRRGESTRRFTGLIAMRDAVLDNTAGLTFEFRIQVPDHNRGIQDDAVLFQVFNPHGSIGLAFSAECIKAGAATSFRADTRHDCHTGPAYQARAVEQTSANTYRIVAEPRSTSFDVYRNGNPLFFDVQGGRAPGSPYEAPVPVGEFPDRNNRDRDGSHFQLGDTTAEDSVTIGEDTSGAFTLDSIRFAPGQFAPGVEPPLRTFAEPPPPPNPMGAPEEYRGLDFDPSLAEGFVIESSRVARVPGFDGLPSSGFDETIQGTRVDATRSTRIVELLTPATIVGNDGWEIALDLATRPGHEELAFYLGVTDRTGSSEVLFSRDRVELRIGRTFHSYALPVFIDTSIPHVYRLYKAPDETQVHLYIDNVRAPVVSNFTTGMSQLNPGHTASESGALQMQIILGAALVLPREHDAVFGASTRGEFDVALRSIRWRRVSAR